MVPIEFCADKTLEALCGLKTECDAALRQKKNFAFAALVDLAQQAGFEMTRQRGSHHIGKHPTHKTLVPLSDRINLQQDKNGKAKPYQVEQLVDFIREAQPKSSTT